MNAFVDCEYAFQFDKRKSLFARNNNSYFPEVEEIYPVAELSDGYWTKPYYDCGGGEIWMVTYSAPFFKMEEGAPVFQ